MSEHWPPPAHLKTAQDMRRWLDESWTNWPVGDVASDRFEKVRGIIYAMEEARASEGSPAPEAALQDLIRRRRIPEIGRFATPLPAAVEANPKAWAIAKAWELSPSAKSLYVYGHEGVGKTALCRYILLRQLAKGIQIGEVYATDFKDRFNGFDGEREGRWMYTVGLLLIDDLSSPTLKPNSYDNIERVLHMRHSAGRPTLCTTQLDPREQHKRVSASGMADGTAAGLIRRLHPYREIELKGETLRR